MTVVAATDFHTPVGADGGGSGCVAIAVMAISSALGGALVAAALLMRRSGEPAFDNRPRKYRPGSLALVRLVIARCSVDYVGRLTAHLPFATRLLMVKADGSVLVHSDGGSYKPLNWMSPPCTLVETRRPVDGHEQGGGAARDHAGVGDARLGARTRRRPGPGEGRRRGAPAEAARRADPHPRRRLPAGPARVSDRDRPGRHHGARSASASRWRWRSSGAARSTASSS